ncbi:MAG: PIN domain-containing protein [Woeseiaceae bacterium]
MAGYLLDTNVLSELLKKRPEPTVVRALNVIPAEDLFTSSICVMELRRGARRHPDAERLWGRIERELLARVHILAFGEREAVVAGDIGAELAAEGRPVGTEDALIAATAMAHGLVVATRDTGHFARVKTLRVIDWWP